MERRKRILSVICALCILVTGYSNLLSYVTFAGTQTYTLTASDGNTYKITVSYDEASGIPESAVLNVREIIQEETEPQNDPGVIDAEQTANDAEKETTYKDYVEKSAELLGEETVTFARVFDITLVDSVTGEVYQPANKVNVKIQLLNDSFNNYDEVEVVHIHGEEKKAEVLDSTVKGEAVEFTTNGFSVYVVISHEGGEIVENPRVEFHYISPEFTIQDGGVTYSAPPYNFVNKGGQNQTTQILKDGEALEMIANPPNKTDNLGNETSFFYGWYTVNVAEDGDTTAWSGTEWTGTITYTWPNPQKVDDEIPIKIEKSDSSQTQYRTGNEIKWTIGESTGTAVLDDKGTAHVYLVPLYTDFYFVNFHMGNKEASDGLKNNLLTRRLIVFGTSDETKIRIGDVKCPSPDPAHQIFSGWETITAGGERDVFYATVDNSGNEVTKTVDLQNNDTTSAGAGFYITIGKNGNEAKSIDLYPVFAEARWANFIVGVSGNGAKYVPSVYNLTNDVAGNGTAFESFQTSERPGYDFKGWYINAAMPENKILNLDGEYDLEVIHEGSTVTKHYTQAIKLTGDDGQFVNGVRGKVFWINDPATESITYGDSLPDGKEKIFEITADGKLYTYKELDALTLSAKWDPKVVDYTVVYWLQNANDDDYTIVDYDNNFQTYAGDKVKITSSGANGRILAIDAETGTDNDKTVTLQGENENADYYVNDIRFIHYKTYDGMSGSTNNGVVINGDGSTVINVYFDRDIYRLRFDIGFARRTSTSGSTPIWSTLSAAEAASYSGTVYGVVNGNGVPLNSDGSGGWTYEGTRNIRNDYDGYRYKTTTGLDMPQYGVTGGSVVELSGNVSYTGASGRYTPATNNSGTQYGIYNGNIVRVYFNNNNYNWYRTRTGSGYSYTYSNLYTGDRFTSSNNNNNGSYNGTVYYLGDGEFITDTTYSSNPYGSNGTYYYPLTENSNFTYNGGTAYSGTRYLRVDNDAADTSYTLGFIDGSMQAVLHDDQGWYYNTQETVTIPYSGTLYGQTSLSGTWQFSVSNITGPNYENNDNWDAWLTHRRYDLGTTNPFDLGEYTGTKEITVSGTLYRIFYYDIVGKYGENILSRYPGSQPSRNNGDYNFVGWLAQRDSFYNARLSTSIKGFFETISEDLVLTGGTIPGWNVKNANANPNNYRAITVDENNTVTGEHGVTQEFRCRYRGRDGYNYLYRIYLADNETLLYPSDPTSKFIITAGTGSYPNLQTPPTYTGYKVVSSKVLDSNGVEQEPGGNGTYNAYSVPELTAANIQNGMIMEFRLMPNDGEISYFYGKGSGDRIGTSFGDGKVKYFGQSLANDDIYSDTARSNTPEGFTFDGWYENPDGIGNKFDFNSTMPDGNIVLYAVYTPLQFRIRINPNGAEIDHIDHTGASYTKYPTPPIPLNRGEITYTDSENNTVVERPADSGYVRSKSTYFSADYGEKVGEYAVSRSYVPISDTAAVPYIASGRHVYAYVNIQNVGEAIDGQWGVPTALRDALYVDATYGLGQYKNNDSSQGETEIYQLYKFYHDLLDQEYAINPPGYWDCDGAKELSFEAWKSRFAEKNADNGIQLYRKCNGKENWVFLGWYKEGESMPYNFNTPVSTAFTLTARWRLDGGYRIQYTPEFYMENGDWINGQMDAWVDPQEGSAVLTYTDGAYTTVFKQPTDLTRNNAVVTDNSLIFRGWRVVSIRHTYADDGVTIIGTEYIPLEDGVYYDPNDDFTIDVQYADSNNIIHMQAVYEDTASSYRRPHVTNLTLDANSGYLTAGSTPDNTVTDELSTDTPLDWKGVGTITMDAGADQIQFGDIQSSEKVQLYKYATTLTHVDGDDSKPALDPTGTNYFTHPNGYFLLGFDDGANEGDFVATYPADAIIAVTRNDDKTIYAVWEPMVYITLKNETGVGPVTFSLSSTSTEALQIINTANGMYSRTPMNNVGSITIDVGESVKLAVPYGAGKDLTISGTNTLGIGYLLSAESVLGSDTNDPKTVRASFDKKKNTENFSLTDTLVVDETGLIVTFTAEKNPHTLVLDDNYTGGGQQEIYFSRSTTDTVYFNDESVTSYTLPTTSTRVGYEFIGWDPDPNWKDSHNVETESPAYNVNDWLIDDLTAFFTSAGSPLPDLDVVTLYAVWKVNVEATKVYVYKNVPDPGNQDKEFTFTVSLSGKYTYTTRTSASASWVTSGETDIPEMQKTISLSHGQYLKVTTTKHDGNETTRSYLQSEIQRFEADGTEVGSSSVLLWEWGGWDPSNSNKKSNISFTKTNMSVTEADYTSDYYDTDLEITGEVTQSSLTKVDGRTLTWNNTDAGGTVVVTNTRQTATITVKKELENNTHTEAQFNFKAAYTLTEIVNGSTVTTNKDFGTFPVTSGPAGHDLEKIPVGAILTVTEYGADLCDYTTTAKLGTDDLTVAETKEGSIYNRAVELEVTADNTVTYKNILKSYPVRFIKVDQGDTAGRIEAFFNLLAPEHSLGTDLYARPSNGDVFYVSGGANEPLYAGQTYTLRETWVQDGFEGLDGAVTIKVSGEAGKEFTVSDTDHVTVSYIGADDVWEFRVKNQEIKEISVIKKLSDPLVSQRTFTFDYSYTYSGNDVSGGFNMTVVAGSQATKKFTVPVGATDLVISEDTTRMANETDTIADTYDTTVQYKNGTTEAGSSYTVGDITSASDGESVTFTNTRKTVDITVKKIVKADVINDTEEFAIQFTVRHGETPIKNYTVFDNGTPDTSDDLITNSNGIVLPSGETDSNVPAFSLVHNAEKTISIPVGASVLVKENLTSAQNDVYAAFMTMPGVSLKLKNGKADEVELLGPTEDKELRIYNIPSICKVTDDNENLLWVRVEGDATPDDPSDDIYIPAIYDTIHGAFDNIGSYYKKEETGYAMYTTDPANPGLNPYQIQMLVDYPVPDDDVVTVPNKYKITFTTSDKDATDGYPFRSARPDGSTDFRAVLTRDSASEAAFCTVNGLNNGGTTFTMSDLIVDGDGATLNAKGGAITAYNSVVSIDNCIIRNFIAAEGGAVFTTGAKLTVSNSEFDSCKNSKAGNGFGGGGINTMAGTLTVEDTTFKNCSAIHQGGAVYHFGGSVNSDGKISINKTGKDKVTTISRCIFEDCFSRAGGGVEADVGKVTVTDCQFIRCKTQDMPYVDDKGVNQTDKGASGGGLNNYTTDFTNDEYDDSELTVSGCSFLGCSLTTTDNKDLYGGGLRSTAKTTELTGCTFGDDETDPSNPIHCSSAKHGGGAAFIKENGTVTVNGCTFTNCTATRNGGAIYTMASDVTIQKNGTTETEITGSSATNFGGGIYVKGGLKIGLKTEDSTSIASCTSKQGGAIYAEGTNTDVTITGCAINGNYASTSEGGGAIRVVNGATVTVNGGAISNNYVAFTGGGKNANGGAISAFNGTVNVGGGTISGNYVKTAQANNDKEAEGGAIYVSSGILNVTGGSITGNYAEATTNGSFGGAIVVTGSATVATISGGTISGNHTMATNKDAYGGAVVVRNGANLTISGGTITNNYAEARTKQTGSNNNPTYRYASGGAVAIVDNGVMTLTGGTISDNYAKHTTANEQVRGAGIFIGYKNTDTTKTGTDAITPGTLYISGNPSFGGSGVDENGNIVTQDDNGKTIGNLLIEKLPDGRLNGEALYQYARQDIYLAGYNGTDADSIHVNGALTGATGTIWVWAEQNPHYVVDQQFAIIDDGVTPGNLLAFRNARDNGISYGSNDSNAPLYGKRSDSNTAHVIWGPIIAGTRKVILRKVQAESGGTVTYVPLSGAKFEIHKGGKEGALIKDGNNNTEFESSASGVYFIGVLPYGTYYICETKTPDGYKKPADPEKNWFILTVAADGVTKTLTAE